MTRPISDSKRGDNTYLLKCEPYGGHRHYAVCVHIVERCEQNATKPNEIGCKKAFLQGNCPAKTMRREERKAGEAIYFLARESDPQWKDYKSRVAFDVHGSSFQRGWEAAGRMLGINKMDREHQQEIADARRSSIESEPRKPVAPRKTTTPRPAESAPSGNLYADLVNKMMKEQKGET
jgi:hypothetical protein